MPKADPAASMGRIPPVPACDLATLKWIWRIPTYVVSRRFRLLGGMVLCTLSHLTPSTALGNTIEPL